MKRKMKGPWLQSRAVLKIKILALMMTGIFLFASTLIASANAGENSAIAQQQKSAKGKVTDEKGEALPGVTVLEKGTSNATITDFDGNFTLSGLTGESVLVFSFIGMRTEEAKVGNRTTINVSMVEESIGLEEVVAVGYGSQKKATLTGSIETVSSEVFQDRAVTSPALALQGQTPGLVVTRSSARPGNEGIKFQIRGETSVNGGDPLIVIDGSPAVNNEAFYNMSPDDIESISVLKDGSAAIYGSRAANGVILVTTKKGKGKLKVELTSNLRINSLGIKPPTPTMEEYATVWLEAAEQDGAQANYWGWQTKENLLRMQSGEEGIYPTQYWGDVFIGNYPRYDEMYGGQVSNQHNLSMSGSSDKSSYRISAGYSENVGSLKTAYDGKVQYNVRFNYDYNVTDWFKLETGVSYFKTEVSSPSTGLDASSIAHDPPFFPSQNPYGQWYANFNIAGNRNSVAATVDGGRENTKRDQLKLNFAATMDITKDLNLRATASFDKDFYNYQSYTVTVPQYTWFGELAPESVNSTSSIRERSRNIFYQNYGTFLNYSKEIDNHSFSGLIGVTAEMNEDKNLYGYRKGFDDFGVYDLNLGSEEQLVEADGGAGHWGLYSYVARFNYNYQDKYLLELNGRRDGSSKFHEDYRWSNFGGGSLGWVVSEEEFIKSFAPIDFLKLRASYGEMGNQVGIGNYDYLSTMSFGTSVFGVSPAYQTSAWLGSLISYDRSWERVGITTIGADYRLLDNRLYGSFDYFWKKNDGMLIPVNYPDLLGGTAPKSNSGILKTHGWELVVGWKSNIGELKYNVSVNLSDNRNKLVSMEGQDSWSAGKVTTREGYPLNSYFMYETDGFFASENEVNDYYAEYTVVSQGEIPSGTDLAQRLRAGDIKKVDLDGNGYISAIGDGVNDTGDVKYMGDAAPHYNFGINLGAQYRNFDFSAFFQGSMQQYVQRSGYLQYPFYVVWSNQTSAYIGKTWTEENPNAPYPRMTYNTTRSKWNWANNDFTLQNNKYIRLKTLVLGYTFSDLKIDKYNIEKLRLYFSGNDLFEFTKVKDGYDPEFGESTNSFYPFIRTWSFGLNLTF